MPRHTPNSEIQITIFNRNSILDDGALHDCRSKHRREEQRQLSTTFFSFCVSSFQSILLALCFDDKTVL